MQQFERALVHGPGPLAAVAQERPFEVVGHAVHRVQRTERVLEHHLDAAAVGERGAARFGGKHVLAGEADLAAVGGFEP